MADISRRDFALTTVAAAVSLHAGVARAAGILDTQKVGPIGLDLAAMDKAVMPGDDFYRYVSGTWLRNTPIPSDRGRLAEFGRLDDLNVQRNQAILKAAAARPATPEETKLGDFYASLMDETGVEGLGIAPLRPELARIAAIATRADLARAIAQLSWDVLPPPIGGAGVVPPAPISASVAPDPKNPGRYLPVLVQGGIGMPDRDYYFSDNFSKARAAYRPHIAAMLRRAGLDDAEARAGRVYALEERLAKAHWTRQQQRDVEKSYNLFSRSDLGAKAPGLDWDAFLSAVGFGGQNTFLIRQPQAIAGAADAVGAAPLTDWRDYLAYRVIRGFALVAPKAIVQEHFAFEEQILAGTPELPGRGKRSVQIIDRGMGHAVGRIYLTNYFSPQARARAEAMTGYIRRAMAARINGLGWMTPPTKARALAKLKAVRIEIGGQQPLRTYEKLIAARGDAFGNVLRAARFDYQRNLDKLSNPVDRGEWAMLPQTVNAQSNNVLQKIMFPAGIMQGLFFNPQADPAVNFGAIGVVMGHELSHQFDDQGSKFDEHGALNNWWTPDDLKQFTSAIEALAKQYDGYEPISGMHINGHLTLGENVADLAGLSLARDAYYLSLNGKPAPVIGALTADQRLYMSYNQSWRALSRDDSLRQDLATNPHSPGEWRAAEVRNVDPWYEAFSVKPGQKMYLSPEQRVKIW
jgi:putative endopeptidase